MDNIGSPEPQRHDQAPFREQFIIDSAVPADKQDVIHAFASAPELKVRQLLNSRLLANLGFLPETKPADQLVQAGATAKRLQTELEGYHIHLPLRSLVVSHGKNNEPALYTVTDKIHGLSLEDALRLDPSPITDDQLFEFFNGLWTYYRDKQQSGDDFIIDLTYLDQYMFGRKANEASDQIYLVDIDPFYGRGERTTAIQGRHEDDYDIELMLSSLPNLIEQTGKLIGRSAAPDVEQAITQYLDSHNIEPYYDQAA